MRLVTRLDFDGVACGALLRAASIVDEVCFVHPKELQDGKVSITGNDVIANLPYVKGCGLWFDHHSSEVRRIQRDCSEGWEGASYNAPSCARVIFEYYGGAEAFPVIERTGLIAGVDKCDSAMLSDEEIRRPEGWVLLSFILDPRTGLNQYPHYRISSVVLTRRLMEDCRTMHVAEILKLPYVVERVERYFQQEQSYKQLLASAGTTVGNVLVVNLLPIEVMPAGNRFIEYVMYPEQSVSIRVMWGVDRKKVVLACGKSVINRSSDIDIGELMLAHGGGGHRDVGTCQVSVEKWQSKLEAIVKALQEKC